MMSEEDASLLYPFDQLQKSLQEIAKDIKFDDAHVEIASGSRKEDLITFLKEHFAPDEVTQKSLGLEFDEEVCGLFQEHFKNNPISLILVSDSTGDIIACRTMYVKRKDNSFDMDLDELENEKLKSLVKFWMLAEEFDTFDRFETDAAIGFSCLGTHKDHRGKGIATKMMKVALEFVKHIGLNPVIVTAEGTSNISQGIIEKCGFETLHTCRYDEYKDNGKVVFQNTGVNVTFKVYVKKVL